MSQTDGGPAADRRLPAAVHLVGIGGMHMSAIAQILLRNGTRVSGSDQMPSPLTEKLRGMGADVRYGHAVEHLGEVDLVVTTAAAKADNPELLEAARRGIPVISRAAMVARLMAGRTGVCVAGTHGKTTTSSMIAWMLREAGRDPSFLLGGESVDLGTNAWAGEGDAIVVEADEYARAFLEYHPTVAVVTNVEFDHLEYYGSVEAYEEAFRRFMRQVQPDGVIVACADSERLAALAAEEYPARVETYRLVRQARRTAAEPWDERQISMYANGPFPSSTATVEQPACWAVDVGVGELGGSVLEVFRSGAYLGRFSLRVAGGHMAANALGAIAAGHALGLSVEAMRSALASFRGARRRFELVGEANGITVIDDFAHHPTEVRANILAARERYPNRRLIVVFQPHTYSRTAYLFEPFQECFKEADHLLVLETYASREAPEAGLSAEELASAVKSPPCDYVRTAEDAAGRLRTELRSGDVLVTMGAGDVDRVGRAVIEGLRES
jgi:UDP-N-acetylmuramate--alanine ligase